jgi:hypothetical protein
LITQAFYFSIMKTNFKSSISSRVSVRGLIIACMPAAALGVAANSPVLGAVLNEAHQGLAVEDNSGASTNSGSAGTNNDVPQVWSGMRG